MKNCKSITICFIGYTSSDKGKTIAVLEVSLTYFYTFIYFLIVRLLFLNVIVFLRGVVQMLVAPLNITVRCC